MELINIPEAFTLPLRLSLISCLVDGEKTFSQLKNFTKASDGNISVQLAKLQKWGYIESKKIFTKGKNQTVYSITEFGLDKLEEYVLFLEKILRQSTRETPK